MREIRNINSDWLFSKNNNNFDLINLPHTWNAIDGQSASDYYRGACTYTKTFSKPKLADGEQIYLEINGANSSSTVSLNGKVLAHHDGGYSTYRVNIGYCG